VQGIEPDCGVRQFKLIDPVQTLDSGSDGLENRVDRGCP
jgi:hypothetical protein